ncbi:MAG: GHKL domain-containing protein [Phycisphaeraceae bacterium]|nr:GHKL domain-containing protein [Phycisphaerales bacterium]MCB9860530.1 GHKL domain-containing protein [Phycisphaeraceae bacterium]
MSDDRLEQSVDVENAHEMDDLMAMFHTVTARLESSQRSLRDEVSHLRAELHEANEQLARSRRLAALGEMAAGIAHEIRNPLGSIGLDARILFEDLDTQPQQQVLADRIRGSVRRLNSIVGDVLSFARECSARLDNVDAECIVDRAIALSLPGVEDTEHKVSIEVDDSIRSLVLTCDADLLEQAMINVIRNAIEAMNENRVDQPWICIGAQSDDAGRAIIVIEDAGPGIPDGVRDRIFNPFFTTRHTGTGLGLAIVHRIMDAHGGEIHIGASQRLGGACVKLALPNRSSTLRTNLRVDCKENDHIRTNGQQHEVFVTQGLVRQAG